MADFSTIDWVLAINSIIAVLAALGFLKNKSVLDSRAKAVTTINTVAASMDVVSGGLSKVSLLMRDIAAAQDETSPGGITITPEEWQKMQTDLAGIAGSADSVQTIMKGLKN